MTLYTKNLSEPWFSLIKLKIKVVEGRLNKGNISNMKIGDFIIFENNELGFERKFSVKITNISYYDTFKSYLQHEYLYRCLPGIENYDDGLKIYYKYYKKEDEELYKIKALTIETI